MVSLSPQKKTKVFSATFLTLIGSKSKIKCKAEAKAPTLLDYMNALKMYESKVPKAIQVVTDDVHIFQEISGTAENGYFFLDPEPAPRRIPDKVKIFLLNLCSF